PHFIQLTRRLATIFLLDVSQSVRSDQRADSLAFIQKALQAKKSGDQAGLIVFGKDPYIEIPPTTDAELNGVHAAVSGDSTNIQAALQAASSAFDTGTARRVVLLSDGDENVGDAEGQIASLKQRGVQIDIAHTDLSPSASATPEALVDDLVMPSHARQDSPFSIRTVVASNVKQKALLHVRRDGKDILTQSVALKPGKTAVVVTERVAAPGFHRYDVHLDAPSDTISQNNQAYGYVSVQGKPRILYVADSAAPSFDTLKRAMAVQGIATDIRGPKAISTNVAELETYDSIVFGNVASTEFSPDQLTAVHEAVHDFGVGFGMIGGDRSYAAGDYGGTPIESLLPVSVDIPKQRRLPAADVVIVLDASGSMSATEDGVEKVELAARAAINLMTALQPQDRVAVIAVTETPTLVVPLQPPAKAASARASIEDLHAGGGGIYCRTGLEAAYSLLEANSTAPIKHVIICPDTTDSEQQEGSVDLAAQVRKDQRITTSVCGIGQWRDQHVPYQKALAAAGGGQLFVVDQATNLPSFFQRDMQMVQQSLFVEKPTLPVYSATDMVTAGVPFQTEPPLLGYNLTTPKPGADLSLTAPGSHDPIFAHWQYGLGRTFAFTSDDRAHWAAHWLTWPGYTRFWSQVLRWSLRANQNANLQAVADSTSGRGHIVVDAFSDNGGYENNVDLSAKVAAPNLSTSQVRLAQTGPGRYEATFDASQTGSYLIDIQHRGTQSLQTVGLVVPYSPEFKELGPNLPLLTRLAEESGGRILRSPAEAFRQAAARVVANISLAPVLLLLAGLLFLLDVAWRRLGWMVRPKATLARVRASMAVSRADTAVALDSPVGERVEVDQQVRESMSRKRVSSKPLAEALPEDDYLNRKASTRIIDEDDPFPYVASLPPRTPRQIKPDDKP
ncbi:MAG TPA: VWA domain-containing protein, partial [Capsulimonadaceae bacterium]|nr:VWA domain-containing protein [Capsulimonadaceae bacterium]